jgi:hypothetical protein
MSSDNSMNGKCTIAEDRLLRLPVILILGIIFASGIFYHVLDMDLVVHVTGVAICPFHAITGIPCPGCGMTRAMLSLGQLQFGKAMHFNPFCIFLLIVMVSIVCFGKIPSWLRHPALTRGLLIAVLVYWIIRITRI